MNWGKSIIVAFLLFAVFIIGLVAVCVRQDVSLVSNSYYNDELKYQDQIDRINNTRLLSDKPAFGVEGQSLVLHFSGLPQLDSGRLEIFKPSDATQDAAYSLHRESTDVVRIDVSKFASGFYKVRMKWAVHKKEYFIEDSFQL
jgi:hypothetical protein